ncbi:hypothetical protein [Amycolatopsis anabasis]|uniref:hypothetical protein n=1 Tax=Amycolatopsis anabasis TaxID=1840409 RepID=UPI00131C7376|nr:hypothetical protein [Amycolatopsis anabasis]
MFLPSRRPGNLVDKPIGKLDPIGDLGVRPAVTPNRGLPAYLSRDADKELDRVIRHGGLVVVEGPSVSGKTRSAYEALRRIAARTRRSVVVPADGPALRRAVDRGYPFRRKVIWLDRLERFAAAEESLRNVLDSAKDVLVLGTLRSGERENPSLPTKLLDRAAVVRLPAAPNGPGFAAILAGAPAALRNWRRATHPLGAALVSAAVDFRRARYTAPVPFAWLKAVAPEYLDPRDEGAADYPAALAWAARGAYPCLVERGDGAYLAADHLLEDAPEHSRDIPADLWHLLAEELPVDDPHYLTCMSLAGRAGHPMIAWRLRRGDGGPDGEKLLELARTCVDDRMCVACEFAGHDVDLAPLLTEVGTTLSDRREDDRRFRDALVTADQLGVVGMVAQPASPAGIAAGSLAPELVLATAQALLEAERVEAAREWFAVARPKPHCHEGSP